MPPTFSLLVYSPFTADLQRVVDQLRRDGVEAAAIQVSAPADVRRAVAEQPWGALLAMVAPERGGMEVVAQTRADAPDLPVYAILPRADPGADKAALAAGACDVVWGDQLDRLSLLLERRQMASERQRELAAIAGLASALRGLTRRPELLSIIIEHAGKLLDTDSLAIVLSDPATGESVVEQASRWLQPAGTRLPAGEGLPGRAIASRQGFTGPAESLPASVARLAATAGLPWLAAEPLVADGRTIGALCLGTLKALDQSQVHLLHAVAEMAASAIHRTDLYEQVEQRLQRLAALRAIDLAITTSFDLQVTLGIFLDYLSSQLHVDAAAVLLANPVTQSLDYATVRGLNLTRLRKPSTRLHESLAGRVAAERQPIHLSDLKTNRGPLQTIAGEVFASYYGLPLVSKGRVLGVLELYQRETFRLTPDWLEYLEALATQAAIAIDNATMFNDLQRSNVELNLANDATLEGWSRMLEIRGIEPAGHGRRVTDLTLALAHELNLPDSDLVHAQRGALLHDIGMLAIPEQLLLKPGPLTTADRAILATHPDHAFTLLAPIAYLRPALDIPCAHHERWDGSGYPRGLRGESIPLTARLFAVVDTWDALLTPRSYRPPYAEDQARALLRAESGRLFDPAAVELFLRLR